MTAFTKPAITPVPCTDRPIRSQSPGRNGVALIAWPDRRSNLKRSADPFKRPIESAPMHQQRIAAERGWTGSAEAHENQTCRGTKPNDTPLYPKGVSKWLFSDPFG